MYTTITYIGTLNGVHSMWCGFCPEGATIEEQRTVLHADEGKTLRLISTQEVAGNAVWLRDTTQSDYDEIAEVNDEYSQSSNR